MLNKKKFDLIQVMMMEQTEIFFELNFLNLKITKREKKNEIKKQTFFNEFFFFGSVSRTIVFHHFFLFLISFCLFFFVA
mgnify:CR=1 FL=1